MDEIIKNLKIVLDVFNNNRIPIWLNWGTLLGVYRDKKILDNDMDLGTIYLDKPYIRVKFNKIIKELEEHNFKVERNRLDIVLNKGNFRAGIAFYTIDKESKTLMLKGLPVNYLDKWLAKKIYFGILRNRESEFRYALFKMASGRYIINIIPISLICPLRKIKFKGFDCYIPNLTEDYLKYMYGYNWNVPDPNFPHYVTQEHIDCFNDTFHKFFAQCPNCGKKFVVNRLRFDKVIEKKKVECPSCKCKWKQYVHIKGTVLRGIGNDKFNIWRTL